ncbi:MAG: hypothetical protein COA79_17795 [Planctomycetota bacterium]|nr:MAG: hypothetical protein COA79_17795 [Planctomycetota bacterium]
MCDLDSMKYIFLCFILFNFSFLFCDEVKVLNFPGVNNYPFTFEDESGNRSGIEVEILNWIAKDAGFKLKLITAKTDGRDARISMLVNKEVDVVIYTMTITKDRMKKVNFSVSYFQDGVGVVVNSKSNIKTVKDLKGKNIYANYNFTAYKYLNKNKSIGCKVFYGPLKKDIFKMILDGDIDGHAADYSYLNQRSLLTNKLRLLKRLNSEDWGIGVSKDKPGLLKRINASLKKMKQNGELKTILKKYKLKNKS